MAQIVCPTLPYNKYGRTFGNVGYAHLTPLGNAACYDQLLGRSDVARNRKFGLRGTYLQHLLHKFYVAIRRLDEYLRLMLAMRAALQSLDSLTALGRLHGQIAIEGERLTIESRRHHRQEY